MPFQLPSTFGILRRHNWLGLGVRSHEPLDTLVTF